MEQMHMAITAAKHQIISEAVANLERAAGMLAKSGSTMSWSDRLERVEAVVLGQPWEGPLLDRIDQLENHFAVADSPIAALAKSAGIPVGTTREPQHHGYKGFGGALAGLYDLKCG
jgi:hypothetical protein